MPKLSSLLSLALLLAVLVAAAPARAQGTPGTVTLVKVAPTLTGREVIRDGFHFQALFGFGGGPDSAGLLHAMEIGGTFRNGVTLALLHTFIWNQRVAGVTAGPNVIGGWMPEVKIPLHFLDLDLKLALGPGGIRREGDNQALWGVAWFYGVDLHLPIFRRSGLTLGLQMIHAVARGQHHFGGGLAVGYTFF